MNSNLMIFENPEFGAVRSILIDGDPWFVGKDVASSLGYSNHRKALLDHVDGEDKLDGVTIRDPIGRGQKPIFISESGLYSLILSSKLERAKKFKRWVTAEVLPSIRKHGAYMTDSLLDALEAHPEAVPEYLNRLRSENARNRVLTRRLRIALPKRSITTPLLTLRTAPTSAPLQRSWAFPKSSLPGIWRKRSICSGTRTASSFPVRSKRAPVCFW